MRAPAHSPGMWRDQHRLRSRLGSVSGRRNRNEDLERREPRRRESLLQILQRRSPRRAAHVYSIERLAARLDLDDVDVVERRRQRFLKLLRASALAVGSDLEGAKREVRRCACRCRIGGRGGRRCGCRLLRSIYGSGRTGSRSSACSVFCRGWRRSRIGRRLAARPLGRRDRDLVALGAGSALRTYRSGRHAHSGNQRRCSNRLGETADPRARRRGHRRRAPGRVARKNLRPCSQRSRPPEASS
jgi:hypothetical protein